VDEVIDMEKLLICNNLQNQSYNSKVAIKQESEWTLVLSHGWELAIDYNAFDHIANWI